MTRWPHKNFVLLFIFIVLAVGGAGLYAGWTFRGADSETLANADKALPVLTTVEAKTRRLPDLTGQLDAAKAVALHAVVPDGASSAVVTDLPHAVGDSIRSGQLVAAVSGKPTFGLNLEVPLYRTLELGQSGPDVASLNHSLSQAGLLAGAPNGTYTQATSQALRTMFAADHYMAPGAPAGTQITPTDIIDLPAVSARISQQASVNEVLSSGDPVVTATAGVNQMTVRVDSLTRTSLQTGGMVAISATGDSDSKAGKIVGISGFKSLPDADAVQTSGDSSNSNDDAFAGYDVRVSINFGRQGNRWPNGTSLNVTFSTPVSSQPAVPLTSVREVGASPYVRVLKAGKFTRVGVEIESQQDGWALVKANGALKIGEKVLVSK